MTSRALGDVSAVCHYLFTFSLQKVVCGMFFIWKSHNMNCFPIQPIHKMTEKGDNEHGFIHLHEPSLPQDKMARKMPLSAYLLNFSHIHISRHLSYTPFIHISISICDDKLGITSHSHPHIHQHNPLPINKANVVYKFPCMVRRGHRPCATNAVNRTYSARQAVEICLH